ncbi:TonB-dependent receptor, partial [candidate division KSB1 bacterium]
MRASIIGYTPVIEKGVRVSVDLTTKVDFSMNSETLQLGDVVEVIAERPLIQKDVTASTKITTAEEIKALPVVTINEAIALTAGTQGSGSNLHIRGGRAGEVAFLVDGLNIQDPLDRSLGLTVGTSAVSELQIISGGFNAEYGDAQSGVIQLTTQEGKRERYTGRISYQTDHFGDSGISNSTQG